MPGATNAKHRGVVDPFFKYHWLTYYFIIKIESNFLLSEVKQNTDAIFIVPFLLEEAGTMEACAAN